MEAGPKGITVEFDNYHTHFRYSEGGPAGRENAFVFIQALQREAYAVASYYEGRKVLRTWVLNPIEGGAIHEYPLLDLMEPGSLRVPLPWKKRYVNVCSWAGSFDRWYDLRQARQHLKLPRHTGEIIDFDSE